MMSQVTGVTLCHWSYGSVTGVTTPYVMINQQFVNLHTQIKLLSMGQIRVESM